MRRDDAAIVFLLEFGDPADMIAMMMGDRISVRCQPSRSSALMMGPASGASIEAVALVSTSWIR
jgi:hypothetical protein